jgi:HPr kinase/phosphorylase
MIFTVIKFLDERELMASSRPLNRGYMECRGIGIINIGEMFGIKCVRLEKRIDLVVTLREWTPDVVEERTGLEELLRNSRDARAPHRDSRPARPRHRTPRGSGGPDPGAEKDRARPARDFNDRLIRFMNRRRPRRRPRARSSPSSASDPADDPDEESADA